MQRTRPGPAGKHENGHNGDWEPKHGQYADNRDRENLCRYVVVSMMALDIVFLAVAPIDRDPKSFVFKFAIDPFLDLVRKLIGRGRCRRNRGRSGNSGSSRCRERGRRSRRFRRSGRCLCVDGQHQAKNSGTAKNKCFHSFHLLMRCRLSGKWIQKSFTLLGQRWRFAKARPEPDLRYLSNAMAVFSATNAKYATISHGANFAVCGDRASW